MPLLPCGGICSSSGVSQSINQFELGKEEMHSYAVGVLTASLSPLAMTFGFILWGKHWQSTPFALNIFKCTVASFIFMLSQWMVSTRASQASLSEQGMIFLSSLLGIVIGDNTWLAALQLIGAKQVIVIDTLKPFLAALLGAWVLHEELSWKIALGIITSSIGILLVSLDRESHEEGLEANNSTSSTKRSSRQLLQGYCLAAINVILDAVGSLLTKIYGEKMTTWEINFLRFGFASVVMAFLCMAMYVMKGGVKKSALSRSSYEMVERGNPSHAKDVALENVSVDAWYVFPTYDKMSYEQWGHVVLGILFVTFICPALSNYALFQIPLGICLTLTSLGPIYSVPLVWFMTGETTGRQGMLGAILAVGGIFVMTIK